MHSNHTIIIGAGIVGVCTAYELARRGVRVSLLESGKVGSGASSGPAGIIAVGHPPLPRPGLIFKTLKWMLDGGSPLYIPPRLDPQLIAWLWNFMRACNETHFSMCMEVLTELGVQSKRRFDQLVADERIECEYHDTGWIEVFLTEAGLKHGLLDAQLLEGQGLTAVQLTGDDLRRREPAFRDEVIGAIHYQDSAFANPGQFLMELSDRAVRHGVELRAGAHVSRIDLRDSRFAGVELAGGERIEGDCCVLAAGSWTTALARTIGVHVPMQPGKGYHLNLTRPDPNLSVACVLAETFVAATPMDGGLRLAGTVELSGLNHRLVQRRVDMLSTGAKWYLHGIEQTRPLSSWCGLRPCTADGLPVIGWAPSVGGVFLATGHAKMGFALGPITGQLACQSILGERPSVDLAPYSPARFLGGRRAPGPAPGSSSSAPTLIAGRR